MMRLLVSRFPLMLTLLFPPLIIAGASTPAAQVEDVVNQVIATLNDQALGGPERRAHIRDLLQPHFDFEAMSRNILARNWKRACSKQRQRFIQLFTRLLENTYIIAMETYTGQQITIKGERVKGKRALVETLIEKATGPPTSVNYRLMHKPDGWQAYDVVIGGVSLVGNYRTGFRSVVRREGMEGLLRQMAKKLSKK